MLHFTEEDKESLTNQSHQEIFHALHQKEAVAEVQSSPVLSLTSIFTKISLGQMEKESMDTQPTITPNMELISSTIQQKDNQSDTKLQEVLINMHNTLLITD